MLCYPWFAGEERESRTWSIGRFAPISTIHSLSALIILIEVGGLNCIDVVIECFLLRRKYGQLCWYKLIWNAFFNGINLPRAFSNKWQQQTFFALKFIASMFFYFCSYLCFYWNHCWFVVCFLEAHLSVLSTSAFVSKSNNICFNSIFWWTNCCKKQTLPWTNISDIKK